MSVRASEVKRGWLIQTVSQRGVVTTAPYIGEYGNVTMVLEDEAGAPVTIEYMGRADPEVQVIEERRPRTKSKRTRDPRTREVKKRLGWP